MQQESNVANKQIESLEYLTKEINELQSAVLNGTVIIESTYVSRETNHQVLATPRLACENLRVEIELKRYKGN